MQSPSSVAMLSKLKLNNHQRIRFCTSSRHPPPLLFSPQFKAQQSANDLIGRLCKQRRFREALQAFHSLRAHHPACRLFPSTYAHLFVACSALKSLTDTRLLHRHLSLSGLRPDVVLHNHVLNAYGKCGSVDDARLLFDAMPERNNVSWSSMISGCSQNDRESEAVAMYIGLLRSGIGPDRFALGSVVRACSGLADVELGRQLHGHTFKMEYGLDSIVQNALVLMYSKSDRIRDALSVFERIVDKDLVSWGSMMTGFSHQGFEFESLFLFRNMLGVVTHSPNEFHFGSSFKACGSVGRVDYGEQIHSLCLKFGMENNVHAGCSLSEMYARCGRLDCARRAFCQIDAPDLVSWNSIIGTLANGGLSGEALLFFSEMRHSGCQPDNITLRCLLCAFKSSTFLCQGQAVHSYTAKTGLYKDIGVLNTLLTMYTKCSDLSTAFYLFEEMKSDRDLITWNAILSACWQHHQAEEVFRLLKMMHSSNNELDCITLNILLSACADLGYLEMGKQVHAYALKVGLNVDSMVRNAMIDTYAKCGSLDDARQVFQSADSYNDAFSWSSLIVGYAQFGYAKESLQLFAHMQSLGITPNHVTFVGVLTSCSREGLVDEGCYFYNMMESGYGIAPTREHCSCVVDLLARAGRIREAERFINQMPVEPDIIMWKSLLAACRVHNDMEVGEKAAEGILKLDPFNSTAYALLCNIYASFGCWDDVARLRKLMKGSGVRRCPGKSWIKVKGEVKFFIVEDRSHLEADHIYFVLELLWFDMREAGYEHKTTCY